MLFLFDCSDASLDPIFNLIGIIIWLIKIAVPIMLIIWGMLDLGKAVIASKEDEIKSAQKLLIKRAIAAVLVFFVVTIVTVLLSIVAGTSADDNAENNWKDCWDKINK